MVEHKVDKAVKNAMYVLIHKKKHFRKLKVAYGTQNSIMCEHDRCSVSWATLNLLSKEGFNPVFTHYFKT